MPIAPERAKELLRARFSGTEDDERRFLDMLRELGGSCDFAVASVLLKTFRQDEDFGVQESVISVLAGCPRAQFVEALLAELPRLAREAPRWVQNLLSDEVMQHPDELLRAALRQPLQLRRLLKDSLIASCDGVIPEFDERAKAIARALDA